jgi:hypothetical protein
MRGNSNRLFLIIISNNPRKIDQELFVISHFVKFVRLANIFILIHDLHLKLFLYVQFLYIKISYLYYFCKTSIHQFEDQFNNCVVEFLVKKSCLQSCLLAAAVLLEICMNILIYDDHYLVHIRIATY